MPAALTSARNIFGGSQFPGSMTYSKAYNSEGNYAVPGLANYVTHGNSDTFGINWSENVPDEPSFSAGFQLGNSQYSVYGTNDQGNNAFHSLNLHSGYRWRASTWAPTIHTGGAHSLIPEIVSGNREARHIPPIQTTDSMFRTSLPLQGSFSAGINRSKWDSSYLGSQFHWID